MNSILDNSIWPNLNGELGSITTPIPDGVTVKWPDGDALVGNFVYKDGKLVGFVDSKALIPNDTKSSNLPYDCVHTSFERILDSDFTFDGARKNHFEIKCSDLVNFAKINLSEILSDVKFVVDLDESSENKLVVHTDRVDDSKLEEISTILSNVLPANIEVAQYNHNIEISWKDINKYAECEVVNYDWYGNLVRDDLAAVNPNYKNDVTSEGEWIYPLPKLKELYSAGSATIFSYSILSKWSAELPNLTKCRCAFKDITGLTEWTVGFPALIGGSYLQIFGSGNPKKFSGSLDNLVNGHQFFWYCWNLEEFSSDLPSLREGGGMFVSTKLNKTSVLRIFNTIPAYTSGSHPLTIGIHIDHQNNEEVLAAIANAEAKGWTLTVQWNGTPTNTTSTLSFGSLIYAKMGEHEQPNGTTEKILDWGHYVTDPTGYETFRSLESAYEHFGLEMPFIGD